MQVYLLTVTTKTQKPLTHIYACSAKAIHQAKQYAKSLSLGNDSMIYIYENKNQYLYFSEITNFNIQITVEEKNLNGTS